MRLVVLFCLCATAFAVETPVASNLVLPQRHVIHWHPVPPPRPSPPAPVRIDRVAASVAIVDRLATTTIDVFLRNPSPRIQEAEVLLPVPEGSLVTGLDFAGGAGEPSARLLPRDEAVALYRSIVARVRDPALMEFVDSACVRTSVFPVPARGTQRVRLVYQEHLSRDGNRIDYRLPRSRHIAGDVPWTLEVTLRSDEPVASVYSPSHALNRKDGVDGRIVLGSGSGAVAPGSLRLSWILSGDPVAASVQAYPDHDHGGGWFQLVAGAGDLPGPGRDLARQVTLVLDRSGSMNGDKIAQARAAALQVIAGLDADERFNLLCYNHGVEAFAPTPVPADAEHRAAARAWLAAMRPRGGTNIHDALLAALTQAEAVDGELPVVLFLTDGIATVGPTGERVIRDRVRAGNPADCRIFTFGVGADVDSHLLETIADDSGARSTFVLPGEDIERATATVFARLRGPVLRDCRLRVTGKDGAPAPGRLLDLQPSVLGDVYRGEELVVLGRYLGSAPVRLELRGTGVAGDYATTATLDPAAASTLHGHVPRLWAGRRIAELVDAVRALGADGTAVPSGDPRFRELVDEIVALSTEYGILTEYTAFLAEEGSLAAADAATAAAPVLRRRAVGERSGAGAVAQSRNASARKRQTVVDLGNRFLDAELEERDAAEAIKPQDDRALYRRGGAWVEGGVLREAAGQRPDRRIAFASEAYFALAERLQGEHRQAALALAGDVVLRVDDEVVLVEGP